MGNNAGLFQAALYANGQVHWSRQHRHYIDERTGVWRSQGTDLLVTADRRGRDWYVDPVTGGFRGPSEEEEQRSIQESIQGLDWQISRTHILFAEWLREVGPGDWRGLSSLPTTNDSGVTRFDDTRANRVEAWSEMHATVVQYAPAIEPRALSGAVDVPAAGRYRCGARAGQGGCNPCREGRVPELLLEPDGRVRWGATGLAAETAERWGGLEGVWWEVGRFVVVGLRVPGPVEHDPIKIFPTPSVLLVLTRGEGPALTVLQCSWDNPVDGRAGPEPTPDLQDAVDALRCGAWWPQAPEHRIERR